MKSPPLFGDRVSILLAGVAMDTQPLPEPAAAMRTAIDAPVTVVAPGHSYASVTDKISSIVLTRRTPLGWLCCFTIAFLLVLLMLYAIAKLLVVGIGIWGVNVPVAWGFAIVNFVWWIGIGHAGTLISAVLLLLHQSWRTSINRFAEAMTLFAVACAGLYPLLHLGRPWVFYWLFPYPSTMGVWPQFRSALVWDVFAVSTYATVSFLFWFVGLIPDLATLRDRARRRAGASDLWRSGDGLARVGSALAAVSYGVRPAGRARHSAGRLGALDRGDGFCDVTHSRMAQHPLSALLRG